MKPSLLLFIVSVSFVFACSQNSATLPPQNLQEKPEIINPNPSIDEIPAGWKRFDREVVIFYAPVSLKKQKWQGIDSFISQYKNAEVTLDIEHGGMAGNGARCSNPVDITIDEREAKLCYESANRIIASFPDFEVKEDAALHFTLNFNNQNFRGDAEKIIRSIKFKEKGVRQ